jgi:hypothetical protein
MALFFFLLFLKCFIRVPSTNTMDKRIPLRELGGVDSYRCLYFFWAFSLCSYEEK